MTQDFEILLFYKYVEIEDPEKFRDEHRALCEGLGLKGRIIIAKEGINSTVEGTKENISKYRAALVADQRFKDIHFKVSAGSGSAFPKLSVKVREDIVSNALQKNGIKTDPRVTTGKRLAPQTLHEWFRTKPESFHIVDMRNDYEFRVGHFVGSRFSGMQNFRDLPQTAKKLENLKEKTVITVCTGGVRCEKASGYLVEQGFKDVYQLDGGIVSYMEKYPGQDFDGSLYVFDNRIVMNFDSPESHKTIGICGICGEKSENYVNCSLDTCHNHFICCKNCQAAQNGMNYCSKDCIENNQEIAKNLVF